MRKNTPPKIDFKLLAKQKNSLDLVANSGLLKPKTKEHLEGIVNLLDFMEDNKHIFASELLKLA